MAGISLRHRGGAQRAEPSNRAPSYKQAPVEVSIILSPGTRPCPWPRRTHRPNDLDGALFSSSARIGLRRRTLSRPSRTLVRATASTCAAFLLDFSPSKFVAVMAGFTRARSPVRLPISTSSIAPLIAPHAVCRTAALLWRRPPRRRDSGSRNRSSFTTLPAIRALNDVADARVEDDLGRRAGIDASEQRGGGALTTGTRTADSISIVPGRHLSSSKALVALLQFVQHLPWRPAGRAAPLSGRRFPVWSSACRSMLRVAQLAHAPSVVMRKRRRSEASSRPAGIQRPAFS